MGVYFLIAHFLGYHVLIDAFHKYGPILGKQSSEILNSTYFQSVLIKADFTLGIGLIFHAIATTYAALKLSRWAWLFIAGFSIYLFMILSLIVAYF